MVDTLCFLVLQQLQQMTWILLPVKHGLLIGLGLLASLLIFGFLNSHKIRRFRASSIINGAPVVTMSIKRPTLGLLTPIEMRRILNDDVNEPTDGVLKPYDERYMAMIRSRMTAPDTTRPRALHPPYDKTKVVNIHELICTID